MKDQIAHQASCYRTYRKTRVTHRLESCIVLHFLFFPFFSFCVHPEASLASERQLRQMVPPDDDEAFFDKEESPEPKRTTRLSETQL